MKDELQYEVVLKMVLWDEPKEAIFQRLKVNRVSDERAQEIYRAAVVERVKTLQKEGVRMMKVGIVSLILAIIAYFSFDLPSLSASRFGEGVNGTLVIPWLIGFICALMAAFGLWKLIQGGTEVLFASSKRGSIADH